MYTNSFNCFLFTMGMESFHSEVGSEFAGVLATKKKKTAKKTINSSCLSVHLSAWNTASLTPRILVKFHICDCY